MNHRWKLIGGRRVKNEMPGSRKRCVNCLMEVRLIRMGSAEAHKGFTETQYRMGPVGKWFNVSAVAYKLPICKACSVPKVPGTGVITRERVKELKG